MSADDIKNTGHLDELGLSDRGIAVQAAGFVESGGGGPYAVAPIALLGLRKPPAIPPRPMVDGHPVDRDIRLTYYPRTRAE